MDPTNKPPDDGADDNDANDAYVSLLDELNETRKKLREKDSLISETQERLITLEEKVEQLTALNNTSDLHAEDEKADDDYEQKLDEGELLVKGGNHHMHGLDRELADSVGSDSIATYGNYINAQRNLRFRSRKSSIASSVLSNTFRGKGEIEVIHNIARRTHSAEWDAICEDLDINDDENGHARNDHKTMTPFYSPPVQRQRYGDDTVLPHVGWGDLFFDLFYVGAAFNLGVLIKSLIGAEQVIRGVVYFFGSLGPLWACWDTETFYQSRYLTIDYCHRITEVLRYIFVAAAIFTITPFQDYYDPLSANIVVYTLAMMLEQMMQLALTVELYFKGLGDEVPIKNHSLYEIKFRKLPILTMYIVAFVIATVTYVRASKNSIDIADRGRFWDLFDLPMTITAIIYLLELLYQFSWYFKHKNKDVRTYFVPVNVDYLIKRYGEFILLMLGESIASLIGIGHTTKSRDYYLVVIVGIVTVIWLHFLHFESEPLDTSEHALWGHRWNTVCYILIIQVITISLIGFSSTFKVFLYEVINHNTQENTHESTNNESTETRPIHEKDADTLFAIVLSLVVVSLELLNLCHTGIKRAVGHLFQTIEGGKRKLYWPIVIVSLIKVAIFLFCMTMHKWLDEPEYIVPAGCAVVIALSITRVVVHFFLHEKTLLETKTKKFKQTLSNAKNAVVKAATKRSLEGDEC